MANPYQYGRNPYIDKIIMGQNPSVGDFIQPFGNSPFTPGINPAAPDHRAMIPQGTQPQKPQGVFGKLDQFMGTPGGGFLMNLLAQSGYSTMPQSPFGAIGKAALMTQEQQRQQGLDDLNRRLVESNLKVNEFKINNPYSNNAKPPASIAEYNLYAEQSRAAGKEPVPFESWVKDLAKLRATGAAEGKNAVSSPAETATDQSFAQDYVAWRRGEEADALKSLSQLKAARDALRSGKKNLTGGYIGVAPDWALPYLNPEAVDTKEQVEEIVQRNLRLVLGPQFTEKEGERLIARAYNPKLEEEFNAQRLDRLIAQIELAVRSKQDQASYYERNGTLKGWSGKNYTLADFEGLFDDSSSSSGSGSKALSEMSDEELQAIIDGK